MTAVLSKYRLSTNRPLLFYSLEDIPSWTVRIALSLWSIKYDGRELHGEEMAGLEYGRVVSSGDTPCLYRSKRSTVGCDAVMEWVLKQRKEIDGVERIRPEGWAVCESVNRAAAVLGACSPKPRLGILGSEKYGIKNNDEALARWNNRDMEELDRILEKYSNKYCIGDHISMPDFYLYPRVRVSQTHFSHQIDKLPYISKVFSNLKTISAFENSEPEINHILHIKG